MKRAMLEVSRWVLILVLAAVVFSQFRGLSITMGNVAMGLCAQYAIVARQPGEIWEFRVSPRFAEFGSYYMLPVVSTKMLILPWWSLLLASGAAFIWAKRVCRVTTPAGFEVQ